MLGVDNTYKYHQNTYDLFWCFQSIYIRPKNEGYFKGKSRQGLGTNGGREKTSVVLGSRVKSNFIPPVAYLQRSTTSKQLLSMVHDRSSLPRSSRVLIKNISQKCSRDDRKMTLGGLHGHGMVHTSGVGASMVPRGHVIHHQQRCIAQQQVVPTITQLS